MNTGSDLEIMREAAQVLDKFGVRYEMDILATHTNPERVVTFAKNARSRGLKVIIAGAGGAAHLPGMIASYTPLPVIGVPVKVAYSIDGLDAIYSMLQMPVGVPVATMALNNAENAAIYSLQVLGSSHPSYLELVNAYKSNARQKAESSASDIESLGYQAYIDKYCPNDDFGNASL
ncbi:MAG: 5-(carboxyamino)imidazole ribonucleotide mutase [Bacteroidota bacterium]